MSSHDLRSMAREFGRETANALQEAKRVLRHCHERISGRLLVPCLDCVLEADGHARRARLYWLRRRSIHRALQAFKMVYAFEWTGIVHDTTGRQHTACPRCGGINPKGQRLQYMTPHTRELLLASPGLGHRSGCDYLRLK